MQTELVIVVGALLLLCLNWESFVYYLVGTFYFFLEQINFEVYFWTLVILLFGIIVLSIYFWLNNSKIKSLSYVDFMPVDEYEKRKKEWTNSAMLDLVQHPKYQTWKTKLDEQKEDMRRRGILSEEKSVDGNDDLSD